MRFPPTDKLEDAEVVAAAAPVIVADAEEDMRETEWRSAEQCRTEPVLAEPEAVAEHRHFSGSHNNI